MKTTPTATSRFVATHSVLTLDARHPYAAKSLVDAQEMHRTVMSGFCAWIEDGSPDARSQAGVLSTWSVDLKQALLVLVVQSRVPGDWGRVPRAALAEDPYIITVDRTFRAGEVVKFRTVVNPTFSKPAAGAAGKRPRGHRVAHTRPEHVKSWFQRRLDTHIGATADASAVAVRMLPAVSSATAHKGLKIGRAEIRGSLTVTDPRRFVTALSDGIGHARAYSCGLILTR
ncbi:type I-E CRISPR-associated protein Cas6/Cse3/CasE [Streptomyces gamaensis]|uniref:Type I-E CRISPR-associated protein Cas6/Cse3/CasE n=1 Tax=Streptomyces gamaensis TaxID=1763542 RepID=A0ABW0YVD7_9ACTN